jgi:hypothetical protein
MIIVKSEKEKVCAIQHERKDRVRPRDGNAAGGPFDFIQGMLLQQLPSRRTTHNNWGAIIRGWYGIGLHP